jgi:integrase
MEHIEGLGRTPTTLVRYRSAIRQDIVPRIGSVGIDRLQPADIDRFYTGLSRKGLQPVSIRKSHAILSASFNQAVKWGWIDRSPVDRASPPSVRQNEVTPLTPLSM